MQEQPLPSSLEEVEDLILLLYGSNPPDLIAVTQTTLTRLQTSPQAWFLARQLLGRPDDKVRFFGALTVIVKLNTQSSALSDDDAVELLRDLIGRYIEALSRQSSPIVRRKLSSALATYFLHFHKLWPDYLRHLCLCLASRQIVPLEAVRETVDPAASLESLEADELQAALWAVTTMVEDANRVDLDTANNAGLYDAVLMNISPAVDLMARALSLSSSPGELVKDSIQCLQALLGFVQKSSHRHTWAVESLRPLVPFVIASVTRDGTFEASVEFLADTLSSYSMLLTNDHYSALANLLNSPWSQTRFQDLLEGDFDSEYTRFAEFLLAFGNNRIELLMQADDKCSQNILSLLSTLLTAKGYPYVEDTVFPAALEFWSTYAETLADDAYSNSGCTSSLPKTWQDRALSRLIDAISNGWRKIVYPPVNELANWDSNERTGFSEARKDMVDLLQCTYAVAGPQLVYTFAETLLTSLATSSWPQLEAAVFCLGGLADCIGEKQCCDESLSSVFNSTLFSRIQDQEARSTPHLRQTCVSLIGQYTEYFGRNTKMLHPALNFLFKQIEEPSMATLASKSIMILCSSCRHHLYGQVDVFLEEYQRLTSSRGVDCICNEKILGAIASIAQASPDAKNRHDACARLLQLIRDDVQRSLNLIQEPGSLLVPCQATSRCVQDSPDDTPSLHIGLRSLRCLVSVAKGFQTPDDEPINLDAEDHQARRSDLNLRELQQSVISIIIDIQRAFASSPEVTELICSVLRCGFAESEPGPFVLPLPDVASYITRHNASTPRIGQLVSTATSLISSSQARKLHGQREEFTPLLLWVIGLVQQLPETDLDPEVTQNAIEFVTQHLQKCPAAVLLLQPANAIEFFLVFTLRVLDGHEPLPKAAAAEFWTTFADLKDDGSGLLNCALSQAMNTLGPMLCETLARNFGGRASRSELDKLSEPLRKLVNRYPMSKSWLEAGLNNASFPSSKVTPEQKSIFVKKIISLRGSRATNQTVRDFWLSARGSSFAYAS